jgi:protein O-GlcNAc transferase
MSKPGRKPPTRRELAEASQHFERAERLREAGLAVEAIAAYRAALALNPRLVAAHNNAAAVLRSLGDPAAALELYDQALLFEPRLAALHFNRGKTLDAVGHTREAIEAWRRCLRLDAAFHAARHDLAVALLEGGQFDEAVEQLQRVVKAQPAHALAHANLASALRGRGEMGEALAAAERATELDPQLYLGWANRLFMLPYLSDVLAPERIRAAFEGFDRHWGGGPAAVARTPQASDARPASATRRLRVGYVSADFRDHPVGYFFEPLARAHDATRFEAFCYDLDGRADEVTTRLRAGPFAWRDCSPLDDLQLARTIAADRLDVVVDLMGHTARNRLPIYARRLAPLQLMWMGWPCSTASSAIDVLVTDPWLEGGHDTRLAGPERAVCLPRSWLCFQPDARAPAVTEEPARSRGHLTFGSFNGVYKVNPGMVLCWSRLLAQVPDARLLIAGVPAGATAARLHSAFAAHGIDPGRVDLRAPTDLAGYFALFGEADIALDTFPFNGATTTFHTLWMGVPVVSRHGSTQASRMGLSLLANLGMPEFACADEEAYLACALALARDDEGRRALRAGLRQRLAASHLTDAAAFTREWEALLYELVSSLAERPLASRPPDTA